MVRPLLATFIAITLLSACRPTLATPPPAPTGSQGSHLPQSTISIAETENYAIEIAHLTWLYPGPGSVLTSPISVSAQLPAESRLFRLGLFGRDGRLLGRQVLAAGPGEIETRLAFEIPTAEEEARLTISIDDDLGRTVELESIEVRLISAGSAMITPPSGANSLEVTNPVEGAKIKGGTLAVAGRVADFDSPVHIELVSQTGRVLAANDAFPNADTGEFSAKLAYRVEENETVLVVASQSQGKVLVFLKSLEVLLLP